MMRLNNKGQSLVLFILMIPILLGVMALVVDMGNLYLKKNELDSVIEFVMDYGMDALMEDESIIEEEVENTYIDDTLSNTRIELDKRESSLEVLLNYNLKNSKNEVYVDTDKIVISSKTYVDGIFSRIFSFKGFSIESEYQGVISDSKKIIEKIK